MDTYPTDDAEFRHHLSNWHGAWGMYLPFVFGIGAD